MLSTRSVQTNEVGRSAGDAPGSRRAGVALDDRPIGLVELGSQRRASTSCSTATASTTCRSVRSDPADSPVQLRCELRGHAPTPDGATPRRRSCRASASTARPSTCTTTTPSAGFAPASGPTRPSASERVRGGRRAGPRGSARAVGGRPRRRARGSRDHRPRGHARLPALDLGARLRPPRAPGGAPPAGPRHRRPPRRSPTSPPSTRRSCRGWTGRRRPEPSTAASCPPGSASPSGTTTGPRPATLAWMHAHALWLEWLDEG